MITLLVAFQSVAFAGPAESVSETVREMLQILRETNQHTKISQLCGLVKSDVDNSVVGATLLGPYANLNTDAQGVKNFQKLVPSIIMDQFYEILHDKAHATYEILGTVPKGAGRMGVKTKIDGRTYVITVLTANNKVVDVEWNAISLIKVKRQEFTRRLRQFNNDKPVSSLVDALNNEGVNKCS